jgi:hypothetical protein
VTGPIIKASAVELEALAVEVEKLIGPSREVDRRIAHAVGSSESFHFTSSLTSARALEMDALLVFASEIGADGLPAVKLVMDTSTSPVVEYTGIAGTLELAWCAAALRAKMTKVGQ